jgi:hypothetical protein
VSIKKLVLLLLALCIFIAGLMFNSDKEEKKTGKKELKNSGLIVVSEEYVIEKLRSKAEIVGLSGQIYEEFYFSDDLFNTNTFIDSLGKRKAYISVRGNFKLGYDLSQITYEDIKIINSTLIIRVPRIQLISLDLPLDKMEFVEEKGLIRSRFNELERKEMYQKIRDQILKNIANDGETFEMAKQSTQAALRDFLLLIPSISDVQFIEEEI